MNSIKIVRLKTGEDVVGYITEDLYGKILIKEPMCIDFQYDNKSNSDVLSLMNWIPVSIIKVNEVSLFENDILAFFEPTDKFIEYYDASVVMINDAMKREQEVDDMSDEQISELIDAMELKEEHTLH